MCRRLFSVIAAILLVLLALTTATEDAAAADASDDDDSDDEAGNMNQRDRLPRAAREAGSDVTSRGRCAKPTEPRNGRVRLRQRGKVVKFRCVKRFQLYGTARAVCNNRTWSHPPPVCVADGCSAIALAERPGLTMMHADPEFRNAVMNFTCARGFQLVGSSVVYCDGQNWSNSAPRCVQQPPLTTSSVLLHWYTTSSAHSRRPMTPRLTRSTSEPVFMRSSSLPPLASSSSSVHVSPFMTAVTTDAAASFASTDVVGDSGTTTGHPASVSSPSSSSLESSVAAMTSSADEPGDATSAPADVTGHQSSTADTAAAAAAAETSPPITRRVTPRRMTPTSRRLWSTTSTSPSVTTFLVASPLTSYGTRSTRSNSPSPVVALSTTTHSGQSSVELRPGTAAASTTHVTPLANVSGDVRKRETGSEAQRGSRPLWWYVVVAGSCVVPMAVAVAVCVVLAHRRLVPTTRRYRVMYGEDEMQPVASAAASPASGGPLCYGMKFTELINSVNDELLNPSQQAGNTSTESGSSYV